MKIHLQRNSDGADVTIEDNLLLRAYTANSLTTIEYQEEEDGFRKMVEVSETLANVGNTSQNLISVTTIQNAELVVDSGDTSGTTAFKLVDAGQNFVTTVAVGMRVKNTTDGTYATVEAVDSNTTLSLNKDIMVSGDDYVIYSNAGDTVWINKERINSMYEVNELGIVMLDFGGQGLTRVELQTNLTILKTAMSAKEGDSTYAIASYTASPNTIILATAEGDVEASFIAGDTITVYGEGTANDSIYSVVSAAHAAGQTTITVTETPTAATAYGGRVRRDVSSTGAAVSYDPGVAGTNVTAVHTSGDGKNFISTLTLAAVSYTIAGAAAEAVGALVYTFPAGAHFLEATNMNVTLQGGGTVDADTPEVGMGTVIGTGAVAILSGTAAFEDIVDSQVATDCSATNIPAFLLPDDSLSATGDVKLVHLNIADTWAGADTLTASGTVTFKWSIMN